MITALFYHNLLPLWVWSGGGDLFSSISTLKTLPADDDGSSMALAMNGITRGGQERDEGIEEEIYVDEDEPLEDDDDDEEDHLGRRR